MRVLLATPVAGASVDGEAGSFVGPLAGELARHGADVRVVSLEGVLPPIAGVTQHQAPPVRGGVTGAVTAWPRLRRLLADEVAKGVDVVHANFCFPWGPALPAEVPTVLTVHAADLRAMEQSLVARSLGRRALRAVDCLTAVSPPVAESLQRLSGVPLPPERIRGMPVEAGDLPVSTGGGGLLLTGPLVPDGRADLALEALACVASFDQRLPLVIAGQGPERPALEARAKQLGIADLVRFVEPGSRAQVRELLARADVLVDPARSLGFPRLQVEAAMSGVAVVACWDGGATVGSGSTRSLARLVLPTAEAIADAVLGLLFFTTDLEQRRRAASAVREEYSAASVARRCREWYDEAIRNHHG